MAAVRPSAESTELADAGYRCYRSGGQLRGHAAALRVSRREPQRQGGLSGSPERYARVTGSHSSQRYHSDDRLVFGRPNFWRGYRPIHHPADLEDVEGHGPHLDGGYAGEYQP